MGLVSEIPLDATAKLDRFWFVGKESATMIGNGCEYVAIAGLEGQTGVDEQPLEHAREREVHAVVVHGGEVVD